MNPVCKAAATSLFAGFVLLVPPCQGEEPLPARPAPGSRLTWAPPELDDPMVIKVTDSNHQYSLDPNRDYVILLPGAGGNDLQTKPLQAPGGLTLRGGRNLRMIGGAIRHDVDYYSSGERAGTPGEGQPRARHLRALYLVEWTGTAFVEGISIGGHHLYEAINVATRAPAAKLYLQNIRIEDPILAIVSRNSRGQYAGHDGGDAYQTWAGPAGGLYIDGFTVAASTYQGIFLQTSQFGSHDAAETIIKRFNIGPFLGSRKYPAPLEGNFENGHYFFWQHTRFPVELIECYSDQNPDKPFGKTLWPDRDDAKFGCRVASDGQGEYAEWPGETLIVGKIRQGKPPGGDFVPAGTAGVGYASPGYLK